MSPDDRWRIGHMIEAAEQALAFVQGRERADLDTVQLALPPLIAQLKPAMRGQD